MARVKAIHKPGDYPSPDGTTKAELAELFGTLFPQARDPEFDAAHAGLAIAAQSPKLALNLAKMSGFMAKDLAWAKQHPELNELAIQTLNIHFKSHYTLRARRPHAEAAGISDKLLAAIPVWENTDLFGEEQRLVIEYTCAVIQGDVPAPLFARIAARYGERGAVELTAIIAWWSMWTMFLNATHAGPPPASA